MKYNHKNTLSDFEESLDKIRKEGFNPIAVSQLYLEYTFVFETDEEATNAYMKLERDKEGNWIGEVVGWWHGKEDFIKEVEKYENEYKSKVLIYWL